MPRQGALARCTAAGLCLAALVAVIGSAAHATVGRGIYAYLGHPLELSEGSTRIDTLRIVTSEPGGIRSVEIDLDGVPCRLLSTEPIAPSAAGEPWRVPFEVPAGASRGAIGVRVGAGNGPWTESFDLNTNNPQIEYMRIERTAQIKFGRIMRPKAVVHGNTAAASRTARATLKVLRTDGADQSAIVGASAYLMSSVNGYGLPLANGYTDSDGKVEFTYNWPPSPDWALGEPNLWLRFESTGSEVAVVRSQDSTSFSFWTQIFPGVTATDIDLGKFVVPTLPAAQAFYSLSTLVQQLELFSQNGVPISPGTIVAKVGATKTYYSAGNRVIFLTGPDAFDAWVIAHECGHLWSEDKGTNGYIDYCNPPCETAPCTVSPQHRYWCPENFGTAWEEGLAGWIANLVWYELASLHDFPSPPGTVPQEDMNWNYKCECTDALTTAPEATEGYVTGFLEDVTDHRPDDNDGGGPAADRLALNPADILQLLDIQNIKSASSAFNAMRAVFPDDSRKLWQAGLNNRIDFDVQPPGAPAGFSSSSHTLGQASPNAIIQVSWTRPADDASQVRGYSVTLSQGAPTDPDLSRDIEDVTSHVNPPKDPGTYYFSIRAQDLAGYWGLPASYGPFIISPAAAIDFVPEKPTGWAGPIVPRASGDATPTSVPAPTLLPADPNYTYWNIALKNIGTGTGDANSVVESHLFLSGSAFAWSRYTGPISIGWFTRPINIVPAAIRGGRHTVSLLTDATGHFSEPDEINNLWGHQWVWEPPDITNHAAERDYPPRYATGGWESVIDGSPVYFNEKGYAFDAGSTWNAVTMGNLNKTADYDLRLHDHSTGASDGFAGALETSETLGDLDAIFVNGANQGAGPWDVGVLNTGAGADSFLVQHVTAISIPYNVNFSITMPQDYAMLLFSVPIAGAGNTSVFLQINDPNPAARPLKMTWLKPTVATAGISEGFAYGGTDAAGAGSMEMSLTEVGDHCLAIYREPYTDLDPISITVRVIPTPPNYTTLTPVAWYAPLVPTAAHAEPALAAARAGTTDAADPQTILAVGAPTSLPGDAASTFINGAVTNTSIGPGTSTLLTFRVDGTTVWSSGTGAMAPGGQLLYQPASPVTVRGGRHVFSMVLDPNGQWVETLDSDNAYGEAWVWTPSTLPINTSTSRPAPPAPTGGFADLTTGPAAALNCDGLRLPMPSIAGENGKWLALSVMPGAASDVNLDLYEKSTGAQDGFVNRLAQSRWGPGEPDYLLANFNRTTAREFDVGITAESGTENYFAQTVSSTFLGTSPGGVYGPFTLAANQTLALHDVQFGVGVQKVIVENLSGSIDWGLTVHQDTTFQGKSPEDYTRTGFFKGAGQNEEVSVVMPVGQRCAIGVWKQKASDLGASGTYQLRFVTTPIAVEPGEGPAMTAFRNAFPNPTNGRATIEFDMARSGEANVAVYDVSGARVRELSRGRLEAGRHRVDWDGRDERLRPMPAGIYFIHFAAGSVREQRKLVKLE